MVVLVRVHGHGQCPTCKTNVAPCCAGSGDEAEVGDRHEQPFAPDLFRRAFARLGTPQATVTAEALWHALVDVVDTDLDGARMLAELGLAQGLLTTPAPGSYRLPDVAK
jgi:hypothetical protein